MADTSAEKTEKATVKKRRDARREGQVLKSTEATTAFCAVIMFAFMLMTCTGYIENLMGIFSTYFSTGFLEIGTSGGLTLSAMEGLGREAVWTLISIVLPILGVAIAAGVAINLLQVGFLFTTKPLMPKLSKISPLKGFKRMLLVRTAVELVKSLLKVALLGYIMYTEYVKLLDTFGAYIGLDIYTTFIQILRTAFTIALKMCLVLAIIALFDYLFQWRKHEKDLMMTKQEVKDEYRNTEGDPQIKGRIRQKQRQMSAMRMMESVPTADVVITNPTHYAVALRYTQGIDNAPVVVAMGQDYLAQKIKAVARENGIHIVEDRPLAQALYKICEIDREIPIEFYQAVADILVYVFRQKNKAPGRSV
ncbi:MAG: flagellar biosynthesis protein FlhB [Clostridiales bacterium]|nr:flagellar biosynthesis protein FlhB [Clostridiales bacterium]